MGEGSGIGEGVLVGSGVGSWVGSGVGVGVGGGVNNKFMDDSALFEVVFGVYLITLKIYCPLPLKRLDMRFKSIALTLSLPDQTPSALGEAWLNLAKSLVDS